MLVGLTLIASFIFLLIEFNFFKICIFSSSGCCFQFWLGTYGSQGFDFLSFDSSKQEHLDFLYDSGLSVGRSNSDNFPLGKPVEPQKNETENELSKVIFVS